jgi:hypothetical protein
MKAPTSSHCGRQPLPAARGGHHTQGQAIIMPVTGRVKGYF